MINKAIKWGAYFLWSSTLYRPKQIAGRMAIGKMHTTLLLRLNTITAINTVDYYAQELLVHMQIAFF